MRPRGQAGGVAPERCWSSVEANFSGPDRGERSSYHETLAGIDMVLRIGRSRCRQRNELWGLGQRLSGLLSQLQKQHFELPTDCARRRGAAGSLPPASMPAAMHDAL